MTGGEMVKPHDDVQCHVHHTLFTSSLKALAFLLPLENVVLVICTLLQ